MGIMIFYEGDGRIAGDISARHWRQMRRLLPIAFDLVNEHLKRPPKTLPVTLATTPFNLATMMRDDAHKTEEVNLSDAAEWKRFFTIFDFLTTVDDTFKFYTHAVHLLREQSRHPDELRQI
jgi:hypothetical protein